MPRHSHRTPLRTALVAFLAHGLLAAGAATAQVSEPQEIDASGDYQKEMQACRSGRTAQDRQACMEEARKARTAARRGALTTPDANEARANMMARCEGMPDADMAACRARMMGYGQMSGSVAGGGILRELEVVEMEPGQDSVTVSPRGDGPVLVVPSRQEPKDIVE